MLYKKGEIILYLSDSLPDKEQIEDGLRRELTVVRTVEDFVLGVQDSLMRQSRLNVILTSKPTSDIKANYDGIITGIGDVQAQGYDVLFVTIGLEGKLHPFELNFGNITTFISYAREYNRDSHIKDMLNSDNEEDTKQAEIMASLLNEISAKKEHIEELEKSVKEKSQEIVDLKATVTKMEYDVSHRYVHELDLKTTTIERMELEIREITRRLGIEEKKVSTYEKEVNKLREDGINQQTDIYSLQALVQEYKDDIELLRNKIQRLESELERKDEFEKELYSTRIDKEKYIKLTDELNKQRQEKETLQEDLMKEKINHNTTRLKLNDLNDEVMKLRQGDIDISSHGRIPQLDKHTFGTLNLFYFKVIKELPYLKSSLTVLVDTLKEIYGKDTVVCILKYDDGLNSELFDGVEVYGALGDVPRGTSKFLLYPSHKMFTRAEEFEPRFNTVVFIDYMQNTDYYVSTSGVERYYNVVRYSKDVDRLGLRGNKISLESDSILDLRYDKKIVETFTPGLERKLIAQKIDNMLRKDGIVGGR